MIENEIEIGLDWDNAPTSPHIIFDDMIKIPSWNERITHFKYRYSSSHHGYHVRITLRKPKYIRTKYLKLILKVCSR